MSLLKLTDVEARYGAIRALEPTTGKLRWEYTVPSPSWSRPRKGIPPEAHAAVEPASAAALAAPMKAGNLLRFRARIIVNLFNPRLM